MSKPIDSTTLASHPPDPANDHLLCGQPKPTGEQVAWVLAHFADLWESENGQSYGFVMQRMFGWPSEEKIIAMGPGLCVSNVINVARDCPHCKKEYGDCYT